MPKCPQLIASLAFVILFANVELVGAQHPIVQEYAGYAAGLDALAAQLANERARLQSELEASEAAIASQIAIFQTVSQQLSAARDIANALEAYCRNPVGATSSAFGNFVENGNLSDLLDAYIESGQDSDRDAITALLEQWRTIARAGCDYPTSVGNWIGQRIAVANLVQELSSIQTTVNRENILNEFRRLLQTIYGRVLGQLAGTPSLPGLADSILLQALSLQQFFDQANFFREIPVRIQARIAIAIAARVISGGILMFTLGDSILDGSLADMLEAASILQTRIDDLDRLLATQAAYVDGVLVTRTELRPILIFSQSVFLGPSGLLSRLDSEINRLAAKNPRF